MTHKFKNKWDLPTGISWQDESRRELNKIIDAYNNWQIEEVFGELEAKILLSKIELGKQTIGSQDGGSVYWDELDEMEQFVRKNMNKE